MVYEMAICDQSNNYSHAHTHMRHDRNLARTWSFSPPNLFAYPITHHTPAGGSAGRRAKSQVRSIVAARCGGDLCPKRIGEKIGVFWEPTKRDPYVWLGMLLIGDKSKEDVVHR